MATKNRHIFELRLGKLGLILFVCGMSLLLFSMFLLGIVVGKHMEAYPERFSPGVAELIRNAFVVSAPRAGKAIPSAEAGKSDVPAGGEESFDLTFYKTLGGKKEVAQAAKAAGTLKDQSPETSASVQVPTGEAEVQEPLVEVVGGAVGTVTPPVSVADKEKPGLSMEKKQTAERNEAAAKGRFEIQVAAHQDDNKAEQMAAKLKSLGFASRVAAKDIPGKGKWFRVIVGGFETREKAKTAADRIDGKIRGVKCVIRSSGKE